MTFIIAPAIAILFEEGTAAALPVIVRAVTDEIRALHQPSGPRLPYCIADESIWPCPTVRLCDEIDQQAGVQR